MNLIFINKKTKKILDNLSNDLGVSPEEIAVTFKTIPSLNEKINKLEEEIKTLKAQLDNRIDKLEIYSQEEKNKVIEEEKALKAFFGNQELIKE